MTSGLLTEIDHIAIAVRDLEAAIAYYREAFGAEVHHREVVESDGVEEALIKVADSYIQLTAATGARLADRQVDREAGRGPPPRRLPRRRLRRCARGHGRGRRHADRPGAAAGQPGHDGRLRPPQGQLRHPDRARPGVDPLLLCAGATAMRCSLRTERGEGPSAGTEGGDPRGGDRVDLVGVGTLDDQDQTSVPEARAAGCVSPSAPWTTRSIVSAAAVGGTAATGPRRPGPPDRAPPPTGTSRRRP